MESLVEVTHLRTLRTKASALGLGAPPVAADPRILPAEVRDGPCTVMVRCAASDLPSIQAWLQAQGPTALRHSFASRHALAVAGLPRWPKHWFAPPAGCKLHGLKLHPGGTAHLRVLGPPAALAQMSEALATRQKRLPAAPELTPRQLRALLAAYEAGYYDIPRPVTLKQLAAQLGITTASMSELLRRAEREVVVAYARPRAEATALRSQGV